MITQKKAWFGFGLIVVLLFAPMVAFPGENKTVVCRLAYTSKGYYAPQILASRKGWFNAEGIEIKDVKLGMTAGIAAAEALVSGSADVAVMGDVPALICLAGARDCVLVAAYGGGERMHSIVVPGGSAITTAEDLKGKRLGVQFGSSTHGAVYLYLERKSIPPDQVKLLNMPQKDLIEALISGSIDALAASEPTPSLAVRNMTGVSELACLSGLGNDYPSVIIASRSFAEAHPEAIELVLRGTRKAVDWINADPDGAAKETAVVTGAPASLEAGMFRKMVWKVRLDQTVIDSLNKTAGFLNRLGKLQKVPSLKDQCWSQLGKEG